MNGLWPEVVHEQPHRQRQNNPKEWDDMNHLGQIISVHLIPTIATLLFHMSGRFRTDGASLYFYYRKCFITIEMFVYLMK